MKRICTIILLLGVYITSFGQNDSLQTNKIYLKNPSTGIGIKIEDSNVSPNIGYLRFGDNTGWKFHIGRRKESTSASQNSSTNGVLMTIQDNGNVGIGTIAPNAPLQFSNTTSSRKIVMWEGANNDNQFYGFGVNPGILRYQVSNDASHVFYVSANATSSTELMRIKSDGNVGIGTSNPITRLHINTPQSAVFRIERSGSNIYGFEIGGSTSANNSTFGMFDYTLNKYFWRSSGNNLIIQEDNGNVGIGNTSPTTKLDINGGVRVSSFFAMGNNQFQYFKDASGTERRVVGLSTANIAYFGDVDNTITGGMNLYPANYQHRFFLNGVEKVTFTQAGNVGIGTTTPQQKLDVQGGVNFTNQLYNQNKLNYQSAEGTATNGQNKMAVGLYSIGKKLYSDETFINGLNSILVYDNNSSGQISITRITAPNGTPNNSNYALEIKHTGGGATPGYGGFYFGNITRANATFACIFKAKIPVGYTLNFASNAYGNGTSYWATDNVGTGKWEDYVFIVRCGDSGPFSSTNFFYLTGSTTPSTASPLIWHLSSATVFDCDDRVASASGGFIKTLINNGKLTYSSDEGSASNGQNRMAVGLYSIGRKLNIDENFTNGLNGISIYDNNGSGTINISRVQASVGTPNNSGYVVQIQHNGAGQSPGFGGFTFSTNTKANATYACIFKAKIPIGYTVNWGSNAYGNGTSYWATDNIGTGKWEDYVYIVRCGDSGTFQSTNYFYLTGSVSPSTTNPLIWQLASGTVYDIEDKDILNTNNLQVSDKVGIGTTNPQTKLQVDVPTTNGTSSSALRLSSVGTAMGNSGASIDFYNQDNGGVNLGSKIASLLQDGGANAQRTDLAFYTTNAGSNTEKFRITGNGNLGIGITTPELKMHVNGDLRLGGAYTSSSTINFNPSQRIIWSVQNGNYAPLNFDASEIIFHKNTNGGVAIGNVSIPTGYKLAVAGNVIAEKVKVKKQSSGWPDFVFSPSYKLPNLTEVEHFIKQNQHLPEIPSASEIEKEGQDLGEMNRLLLKKVEELTLYVIELKKENQQQNKQIEALKNILEK